MLNQPLLFAEALQRIGYLDSEIARLVKATVGVCDDCGEFMIIYSDGEANICIDRETCQRVAENRPSYQEIAADLEIVKKASLVRLQVEVGEWGDRTFPTGTPTSIIRHLRKELDELESSHAPVEAADMLILLLQLAHRSGFVLYTETRKKLEINYGRTWQAPDADGVIEHVREAH